MIAACAIVAFVVALRIGEVLISHRNTRVLLARGAREEAGGHYPFIVALHVAWFAALIAFLPQPFVMHWWALAAFALLLAARAWIMVTIGPWFTTRIITLDGAALVQRGPYRVLRHPNYAVVVGEIAALPLAFGEVWVAAVFTILNAAMLAWRIRAEDRALARRRALAEGAKAPL